MNLNTLKRKGSLDSCISASIHCLCSLRVKSQPLVDDSFNIGLAFAAGFSKAFSDKFVNTVHNSYPRLGFIFKCMD